MIDWKIWYGDGTTFTNVDGEPAEAPGRNVQVVGKADPEVGFRFLEGKDYYLLRKGEWIGVDFQGLIDQLVSQGIVKVGMLLTDAEWKEIHAQAMADKEIARKSAWKSDERRP
jgi:hypothetical protein